MPQWAFLPLPRTVPQLFFPKSPSRMWLSPHFGPGQTDPATLISPASSIVTRINTVVMSAASMSKFLTQVKVSMAPFSPSSKTAKIFLSRIITNDSLAANPALKIVTDSHADLTKPSTIQVTYKDGKTLELKTDDIKVNDVLRQVGKHAKKLQEKEDATA
ncbi:hypothetical protein EDD21DRAFT_366676 [Dissophora ornata]|nr:hypothetical protein EDD21DRAFT_366676 [Dissophora ornata]